MIEHSSQPKAAQRRSDRMKIFFWASPPHIPNQPLIYTIALIISLISLLGFTAPALAYTSNRASGESYRQNLPRLRSDSARSTPNVAAPVQIPEEAPADIIIIVEPLPEPIEAVEAVEPIEAVEIFIEPIESIEPIEEIEQKEAVRSPRDPYEIIEAALQNSDLAENPFQTLFKADYVERTGPFVQPEWSDRIAQLRTSARQQPARLSRTFKQFKAAGRKPLAALESPTQGIRQHFGRIQQQIKAEIVRLLNYAETTAHRTAVQIERTENNTPKG